MVARPGRMWDGQLLEIDMAVTFTKALRGHVDLRPKLANSAKEYCPTDTDPFCTECGEQYPRKRLTLGFEYCPSCSKENPVLANSALHKQGYTYERSIDNIRINPYSTHK